LSASRYQFRAEPVDKNTASLNLLEEELRAYPENGRARAEWWQLRFQDAGKTIEASEVLTREIADFWDSRPDKPWAWQAAMEGYYFL
jgi:hypothetical protein